MYVKISSGKYIPHEQEDGKFHQRDENQKKKDSSRNVINKYIAEVNMHKR